MSCNGMIALSCAILVSAGPAAWAQAVSHQADLPPIKYLYCTINDVELELVWSPDRIAIGGASDRLTFLNYGIPVVAYESPSQLRIDQWSYQIFSPIISSDRLDSVVLDRYTGSVSVGDDVVGQCADGGAGAVVEPAIETGVLENPDGPGWTRLPLRIECEGGPSLSFDFRSSAAVGEPAIPGLPNPFPIVGDLPFVLMNANASTNPLRNTTGDHMYFNLYSGVLFLSSSTHHCHAADWIPQPALTPLF